MNNDYRDSKYCPGYNNVKENKKEFMTLFRSYHKYATDVHVYIRDNDSELKSAFIKAYNGKCAYCGVSIKIIPKAMFEIDHIIPYTASCFIKKADAGYIENLALACHTCNHNKSDFQVSCELQELFHPDQESFKSLFYRDDLFYIKVKNDMPDEALIFYEKLKLDRPSRRVDYLLLNMIGLYESVADKPNIHEKLGQAIELLRQRRNNLY